MRCYCVQALGTRLTVNASMRRFLPLFYVEDLSIIRKSPPYTVSPAVELLDYQKALCRGSSEVGI